MKKLLVIAVVAIVAFACTKSENEKLTEKEYNIEGAWVIKEYTDTAIIAFKNDDFIENKGGVKFNADGSFEHRSSSSWCGTPLVYANYPGSWTLFPSNTLFIETEYWGGATSYTMEIVEVSESRLVYRYLGTSI